MTDQLILDAIIKQSVRDEYNRIVRHINSTMPTNIIASPNQVRHNRINSRLCEDIQEMSEKKPYEWNADDFPPINEIYETWLTTAEVVERTDYNSHQSVIYNIRKGYIRGVKLGSDSRGEYRVDPDIIDGIEKDTRGRKIG